MADIDRQFAATPNRLREARRQGHVARAVELPAAVSVILVMVVIGAGAAAGWGVLLGLLESIFAGNADVAAAGDAGERAMFDALSESGAAVAWLTLPIFAAAILGALVAGMLPGGWVWAGHFTPNANRLSPAANLKAVFSMRSGVRLVVQIARLALIGGAIAAYGWARWGELAAVTQMQGEAMFTGWAGWLLPLVGIACSVWLAIAVVDVFVQRWLFARDWRMNANELRDEQRDGQVDPQIRQKQRQAAAWQQQDFEALIPRATVVLTSSESNAVPQDDGQIDAWLVAAALVYNRETMAAPLVIACGRGAQAARMLRIADREGVAVTQHVDAANELANQFPSRRVVPGHLYNDVAKALAEAIAAANRRLQAAGEGS